MDGDAVVVGRAAGPDVRPVPVLLAQVEARRVGHKQPGDEPAGKAKPAHDPEPGARVDIVVDDGGQQGAELARGGRQAEAVRGRAHGNGENLGGEQKGGAAAPGQLVSPGPRSKEGKKKRRHTWGQTAGKRTRGNRSSGSP